MFQIIKPHGRTHLGLTDLCPACWQAPTKGPTKQAPTKQAPTTLAIGTECRGPQIPSRSSCRTEDQSGKQAGCQRGQSQIRTTRRSFGSVQDSSSCARTEAGRRAYLGLKQLKCLMKAPAQVGRYYNLFTSTTELLSSAPFTHALASNHLFVFSIDACGHY